MYIFIPDKTYVIEKGGFTSGFILKKGEEYLITDYHVKRMQQAGIFKGEYIYLSEKEKTYKKENLFNYKNIGIFFMSGIGDLLCFLPILNTLSKKIGAENITLITRKYTFELIRACGFLGELIDYPPLKKIWEQKEVFFIDKMPAFYEDFKKKTTYQLYCDLLGIKPSSPIVNIQIPPKLLEHSEVINSKRIKIGIQAKASSSIKSYPSKLLFELLKLLIKNNMEVHIFGVPQDCQIESTPPLLYNHCTENLSLLQTIALVSKMDFIIAPDSFLMHLGGMLGIKTIALLGLFPASLRTIHYPTCIPFQGQAPCSPCFTEIGKCPLNYETCKAFLSSECSPSKILQAIKDNIKIKTSSNGKKFLFP